MVSVSERLKYWILVQKVWVFNPYPEPGDLPMDKVLCSLSSLPISINLCQD